MEVFNLRKQDFFIIQQLAHKDKFRENSSSFFGQFWQIINPCLDMMILVIIFNSIKAIEKMRFRVIQVILQD
jgi:ABC-2 type transport system permease protein/lipopolysaccharide transport system permease protein